MAKMPFQWAEPREAPKGRLKPWLLLALTIAVLAFCAVLVLR
jgi:hypothetical protein